MHRVDLAFFDGVTIVGRGIDSQRIAKRSFENGRDTALGDIVAGEVQRPLCGRLGKWIAPGRIFEEGVATRPEQDISV